MSSIIKSTVSTKSIFCGCKKKWIRLPNEIIHMIGIPITKICLNNHYMSPFFVHDVDGDYYAPKSICKNESDGKYIYFCTKCKNVAE